METNTNTTDLARGLGRKSYRDGNTASRAVADALAAHPEFAAHIADVCAGWRAERSEAVESARAAL